MLLFLAFCKAGFSERSAPSEFSDTLLDNIAADIGGIKPAAIPAHEFAMLRMPRFGHFFQEVREAGCSANILRRRPELTIEEARILQERIAILDGFDCDGVLPVITEVVGIGEGLHTAIDECCNADVASGISLCGRRRLQDQDQVHHIVYHRP